MLSKTEKISIIDSLLEILESARQRQEMYFLPNEPVTVETWLHGITVALRLCNIDHSHKSEAAAVEFHGLEQNALGFVPQLQKRGLQAKQIIDKLLAVEMDIWKSYQQELRQLTM